MTGLLRSEWRKVTSSWMALGLFLAAMALVLFAVGFTLWAPGSGSLRVEGTATSVASPEDLVAVLTVTGALGVFALLFGVTSATAEFRHATAATTFLIEPRRWRVVVAKTVVAGVVGVLYAVVAAALALSLAALYAAMEGGGFGLGGEIVRYVAVSAASIGLAAVLGIGVGWAIRSQVAGIVAVLVWLFVAENLIGAFLPDLARWLPFAAGSAMTATGAAEGALSPAVAGGVSVAYAVGACLFGSALTTRRDVI